MPKPKPCKALVKRVRVTKKGKIVARPAGNVHRRVVKSAKRRRRLSRARVISSSAAKPLRQGLGLI
jgi:ribosomal protein L35